jgi:hypothetical protein
MTVPDRTNIGNLPEASRGQVIEYAAVAASARGHHGREK